MTLPRYDLFKLASPPEPPPCTHCGHDWAEHGGADYDRDYDDSCQVCDCEMWPDEEPEPDPDAAWERRKAERYE